MDATCCAAIDLGASNGRVVVARLEGERITLLEAARFETPSFQDASGYQCWDVDRLEASVRAGLEAARAAAPLASVGVDTWGVDYGLLDGDGRRTAPVVAYRDARTQASMRETLARMPQPELYRRTGIQLQPFNTVFQLAATSAREPAWLARARRLLFLPDYFHHRLGGASANEYTQATTSALLALETRDWDGELLRLVGVGGSLLSRPVEPGTPLGFLDLGDGGARRTQVIAPATHDTASSVAAIPLEGPGTAYISSGTWSLMGIESPVPLADGRALRLNLTNEGGVGRTYRVLKNIVGLWLVQKVLQELGGGDHAALVAAAQAAEPWRSLIDPEDPRFFAPASMVEAIRGFCAETGQPVPGEAGALARCAFDSLALTYRRVARDLGALRGRPLERIHIVGGGSRNRLLNQLCADACQLPVRAGPVETAALGNACVQLVALGALPSLAAARALVRRSFEIEELRPGEPAPQAVLERFDSFGAPSPEGERGTAQNGAPRR
jgi:rhamnulokinase